LLFSHFFSKASRVVSWKDPVESGLVFTIITAFFYLITCGGYTVVTLVSYLLLAFLLTAAAYVSGLQFYGQFRGQTVENPLVYDSSSRIRMFLFGNQSLIFYFKQ